MRLIKLILLVELLVAGYLGQGQNLAKNENPAILVKMAQSTVSEKKAEAAKDTAAEKKAEPVLPDNIKLIIGQSLETGYLPRIKAIHQLDKILPSDQIKALYDFLYRKLESQGLTSLEFNALKNEVVIALMQQRSRQQALAKHLIKMYNDKSFDNVWRDYCIQFMGRWYEYADPADAKEMKKTLFSALAEKQSSISGTALNALKDLARQNIVDRTEISNTACSMLSDKTQLDLNRITALQVCVSLHDNRALPVAREILRDSRNIPLKMSAIAVIGEFGDRSDLPPLSLCRQSTDIRLKTPAQSAIAKISYKYNVKTK